MGRRARGFAAAFAAAGMLAAAACSSTTTDSTSGSAAPGTASSGTTQLATGGSLVPGAPAYAAAVEAEILKAMDDNLIPGAVVLIKSPDQGDWSATFGTSEIGTVDPLELGDHFRVGSNTKTMTSTVILQLVQEGKLSLDDPISKYVPGVPNGDAITIANLAEMRSGLYSYSFDLGFNQTLDDDPQKVWTPEELLAIGLAKPVSAQPGETFDYSNTNIILLGVVIEQLTAKTVSEAFQERIFEPLGMSNTELPSPADASIPDPHPRGYSYGTNVSSIENYVLSATDQAAAKAGTLLPSDQTDANPSWAWTAGAAISTAEDLSVYVEALVEGGLLDPEMQKVRMDSIQPTDPANPGKGGYGIGMARFGPHLYGHDGQIPGFMTFMGHDPESGLTVIILTNLATVPSGEGSALTILKAILPTFYGAGSVPSGDPAAAPTTTVG